MRFFSKDFYENELHQEINVDVLRRINQDTNITTDKLKFSFYFISDKKKKIDSLVEYFQTNEEEQQILKVYQVDKIWELNGRSYLIKLDLESINEWEKKMWDIGFNFDCKLDGWETSYDE